MNVQFSFCFITGQQIIPSEMNFKFFNDFINKMRSLLKNGSLRRFLLGAMSRGWAEGTGRRSRGGGPAVAAVTQVLPTPVPNAVKVPGMKATKGKLFPGCQTILMRLLPEGSQDFTWLPAARVFWDCIKLTMGYFNGIVGMCKIWCGIFGGRIKGWWRWVREEKAWEDGGKRV